MNEQTTDLDSLVQEKLAADTEFQSSLEGLNDNEIAEANNNRSVELRNEIFQDKVTYGNNQKIRAEKAEKPEKKEEAVPPVAEPKKVESNEPKLSLKDTYALQQAGVHIDDIDVVIQGASTLGTDVVTALKDDVLLGVLKRKTEERESAKATSTNNNKPSTHKVTGGELLKNLADGKSPEPGSQEADDLFWAKRGGRRS